MSLKIKLNIKMKQIWAAEQQQIKFWALYIWQCCSLPCFGTSSLPSSAGWCFVPLLVEGANRSCFRRRDNIQTTTDSVCSYHFLTLWYLICAVFEVWLRAIPSKTQTVSVIKRSPRTPTTFVAYHFVYNIRLNSWLGLIRVVDSG